MIQQPARAAMFAVRAIQCGHDADTFFLPYCLDRPVPAATNRLRPPQTQTRDPTAAREPHQPHLPSQGDALPRACLDGNRPLLCQSEVSQKRQQRSLIGMEPDHLRKAPSIVMTAPSVAPQTTRTLSKEAPKVPAVFATHGSRGQAPVPIHTRSSLAPIRAQSCRRRSAPNHRTQPTPHTPKAFPAPATRGRPSPPFRTLAEKG